MHTKPELVAWRVLLSAFGVFVVVCLGATYLVQWYLFDSQVNLRAELTAARGTVRMILPHTQEDIAITSRRSDLGTGAGIQTDASQGVLTFYDPRTNQAVATVVLLSDSQLTLVKATAPRFGLNKNGYVIQLESTSGRCEVLILSPERQAMALLITTPQAEAWMTESGHYMLDITDQRTRISTVRGHALVTSQDSGHQIELFDEQRVIVEETGQPLILLSSEVSLVHNRDFSDALEEWWEFYDDGGPPPGQAFRQTLEGRQVLAVDRSQENWPGFRLGHGETGMRQELDVDVQDYNYLEIRTTFHIDEQSLSTCGQLGSECPMMLRVQYEDVQGIEREFIQGFFAYHDPTLDYPLTCDTCRGEHERVNLQSWYTYKSGNLLTILPAEQKPAVIQQVRFYASGHAYKVYVAEMDLLAAP